MGPFFAAEVHEPGAHAAAGWRRMAELLPQDAGHPSEALDLQVKAVSAALAPPTAAQPTASGSPTGGRPGESPPSPVLVEPRVAASITHLGLVARVIAPAMAVAALGAGRVRLDRGSLWWQPRLGGPFPLSVALADGARITLAGSLVEELTEAMAARYRVSRQTLWGNVGSAVNSAARLVAAARADLAATAAATADEVLSDPRIDDGVQHSGPSFRRRSCCLIYRISGHTTAVCGDCVLGG